MILRAILCASAILSACCLPCAAGESLDSPPYFDEVVARGNAAVPGLIAALGGPQAQWAAAALGRIGGPAAAKALLPHAAAKDGELRAAVAWALGQSGDSSAVQPLMKLPVDEYPPARAAAMWALGRLGDQAAASALRSGAGDADRNVRLAAVRGISEGKQPAFLAILAPRLDHEVRWEPEEQDDEDPEKPPVLVEKVHWAEPDTAVRLAVVQALGNLGVVDAVPALIFAMERETSFNRLAIVKTIESFGPRVSGVCLGRIVPTPYDEEAFKKRMPLLVTNGTLAVIAGRLGDERCVPALLKTLELPRGDLGRDKDLTELYIDTVKLLGKFRVERGARPMAALLKETRVDQLSAALQAALASIGRPAARPLAHNAADWRLAPIFLPLLRRPELRTATVRDTLMKFLAHESDEVRRQATETVGLYIFEGILNHYDIPLLTAMYLDPDRSVRQICAKWKKKIAERFGEGAVK